MNTQTEEKEVKAEVKGTFSEMEINPKILDILNSLKFSQPTPIQSKAIPLAIKGQDVVGIAQTGTGKTLAFAIPILQQLAEGKKQALILLPTRELAIQVDETFQKIGRAFGINTAVIIGGASVGSQLQMLRRNPRVIIGTPGRIMDLVQSKRLSLASVDLLVFDEADRMFDMGFAPQIKKILSFLQPQRQTMLFSATMPDEIAEIAHKYMKNPIRVEVARSGTVANQIEQELFVINKDQKGHLLEIVLTQYKGTSIVFSRTKHGARKICKSIQMMGHKAAEIHSNRSLGQRREALDGFKNGKYRVLVATDIASRGIDVNDIELVINYDLPENPEDYVHRIGRTGRAGQKGRAISFATPEQRNKIFYIERLTRTKMLVLKSPVLQTRLPAKDDFVEEQRRSSYRSAPSGHRSSSSHGGGGASSHHRGPSSHSGASSSHRGPAGRGYPSSSGGGYHRGPSRGPSAHGGGAPSHHRGQSR